MNVLQISNYPLDVPLHGGQRRAKAIQTYFASRKDVKSFSSISLFLKGNYENDYFSDENIVIDVKEKYDALLGDILTPQFALIQKSVVDKILHTVASRKIDTIILEQPYLIGIFKFIKEAFPDIKLIYSSHNLEVPLKKGIYEKIKIDLTLMKDYLSKVTQIENECVKFADMILCASKNEFEQFSKSHKSVYLVSNGIQPLVPVIDFREFILKKRLVLGPELFTFLFVGSYHIPNIEGFEKLIGYHLGFLPPFSRIIVVGGVANGIKDSELYKKQFLNAGCRITLQGHVTDEQLSVLYKNADAVILPILSGEGTNLKTAEALSTELPIIGTNHSFRGYEKYIEQSENLVITEDPTTFRNALVNFVQLKRQNKLKKRKSFKDVYWTERLRELDSFKGF